MSSKAARQPSRSMANKKRPKAIQGPNGVSVWSWGEYGVLCLMAVATPLFFYAGADTFRFPKIVLFLALSVVLFGLWLCGQIEKPDAAWLRHPLTPPVGMLVGVYGLSALLAENTFNALHDCVFLGAGLFLFARVVGAVRGPKQQATLLALCIVVGVISSVYGILQYYDMDPIFSSRESHYRRQWATAGFVGQPTLFAAYLGLLPAMALAFAMTARKRWAQVLAGIAGVVILVAIMHTYARAVIFGLPGAVLAGLAIHAVAHRESRRMALGLFGGAAVLFAGALAVSLATLPDLTRKVSEVFDYGTSSTFRIFFWKVAAEMGFDHMVLGIGPGGFRYHGLDYRCQTLQAGTSLAIDQATPLQAHSEYLQAFAETGLIGIFAWMWIAGTVLVMYWRRLGREADWRQATELTALLIGLLVIALNCFVSFPLHIVPSAVTTAALAGILVARCER